MRRPCVSVFAMRAFAAAVFGAGLLGACAQTSGAPSEADIVKALGDRPLLADARKILTNKGFTCDGGAPQEARGDYLMATCVRTDDVEGCAQALIVRLRHSGEGRVTASTETKSTPTRFRGCNF